MCICISHFACTFDTNKGKRQSASGRRKQIEGQKQLKRGRNGKDKGRGNRVWCIWLQHVCPLAYHMLLHFMLVDLNADTSISGGFFHPAALPSSTVLDMLIRWHSSELQRLRNSSPDPRVRASTQPRAADAPAVLPQPQTGLSGFPLRDSLPPHRAPEVYNKPPWGKARDGKRKEMKKCGRFKSRKTTVWLHWRLH